MTTRPLPAIVRSVAAEALALALTLAEAEEIQWQPSVSPKPREDTTERSRGGVSDPVANTVADPRRLAVRDTVEAGKAQLEVLISSLHSARLDLEQAIDKWNGRE